MPTLFRRTIMLAGATAAVAAGTMRARAAAAPKVAAGSPAYPFTLPPLPYPATANEPYIDAQTMELHHGKHHAAYVAHLNEAVKPYPRVTSLSLAEMLARINELPEPIQAAVRNNGGGHAYHSMFWPLMGGKGGAPTGPVAAAINRDFGSFPKLQDAFNKIGAKQFGSGWALVLVDRAGKLSLAARPNQDSPLMEGKTALLGNDVWEHAYYLKYQNRRPEYLAQWWNVLNWQNVNARYAAALQGTLSI
jgi:Fe-Mn family superoxide dismutase